MIFLNWAMLIGLSAAAIPVIMHLFHRRKTEVIRWGAMAFLVGSLVRCSRRILLEEILLLALRCLLLALLVLAAARPFAPAESSVSWTILLFTVLLGSVSLGVGTALWNRRKWRWALYGIAAGLITIAVLGAAAERWLQLRRWAGVGGEHDVAIIIDGSSSMRLSVDGKTNFERAIDEARSVVETIGSADAVSIIVAGPTPFVVIPSPINDRKAIADVLDGLAPSCGRMEPLDAVNAAAVTLANGKNPAKRIVFITDGQSLGWDTANEARWQFLAEALKSLPTQPRLVCRMLSLPERFRNVAIADIALTRSVIGLDRPVGINVRVENTGDEPTTPVDLKLRIGSETELIQPVAALPPGASETVKFSHQFTKSGPAVIEALVEHDDDLAADNTDARVVNVAGKLPVLIIDGDPAERPLDRGSGFLAIALAPPLEESLTPEGTSRESRALIDAKIVDLLNMPAGFNFAPYRVVILANVPQLPVGVAAKLREFVERGGGLLIAPGTRALPKFYNEWTTRHGDPVAGAVFRKRRVLKDEPPASPEITTFSHRALELVADRSHSDIDAATFTAYWQLDAATAGAARVGGMLSTGDPLLIELQIEKGVVLTTAVSLDATGGDLAKRGSFVAFVHEMVYYLAGPLGGSVNVRPDSKLSLRLTQDSRFASRTPGLRAEYYAGRKFGRLITSRVDGEINFRWARNPVKGVPADNFSVRWLGSIIPRTGEKVTFYLTAEDDGKVWIDGRRILDSRGGIQQTASVDLEPNKKHDLRIELINDTGPAFISLGWSSPSMPKQIISSADLLPRRPWSVSLAQAQTAEVVLKDGSTHTARITTEDDTVILDLPGAVETGIYRARLPKLCKAPFAYLLDAEGMLPFAVTSAAEESRLTPFTEIELERIDKQIDFFRASSEGEMVAAVTGGVPGHEMWKYLAVAALAVLLAETALTRWIAVQRRAGSAHTIDFRDEAVGRSTFSSQADKLRGVVDTS